MSEFENKLRNYGFRIINLKMGKQWEIPDIKEVKNKEYVMFGEDNDYPDQIIDMLNNSTLHNSIVVSNVQDCQGSDINFIQEDLSEQTQVYLDQIKFNSLIEKMAWDLNLFGGFYLEIIWGRDKKTIAEINHIPFEKIRSGKFVDGEVSEYYFSNDWSQVRKAEFLPEPIPVFGSGEVVEIFAYKQYRPKQYYYPLPDYIGALKYIELENEIANFHLSNLKNGLNPGLIIFMKDSNTLTEDEKEQIERGIKRKFEGTDNTGKMILMVGEDAPTVTQLNVSDLDKQHTILNAMVLQNVLSAHRVVSPLLVGIKTEGQLGGNQELINAYQIYQKRVIFPKQRVLEDTFNTFLTINGLSEIEIIEDQIIDTVFSEQTLTQILSVDELREMIGYEPKTQPTQPGLTMEKFGILDDILGRLKDLFPESDITKEDVKVPIEYIDGSTDMSLITEKHLDDFYRWETNNQENLCPACESNKGNIKQLREWLRVGVPGQPNGKYFNGLTTSYSTSPYATFCESACRCKLIKI